jgi:hypothetical protein
MPAAPLVQAVEQLPVSREPAIKAVDGLTLNTVRAVPIL